MNRIRIKRAEVAGNTVYDLGYKAGMQDGILQGAEAGRKMYQELEKAHKKLQDRYADAELEKQRLQSVINTQLLEIKRAQREVEALKLAKKTPVGAQALLEARRKKNFANTGLSTTEKRILAYMESDEWKILSKISPSPTGRNRQGATPDEKLTRHALAYGASNETIGRMKIRADKT